MNDSFKAVQARSSNPLLRTDGEDILCTTDKKLVCRGFTLPEGFVIDQTVIWSKSDSPVTVSGILIVSEGGTLVIDAGTTVMFQTPVSGLVVKSGGQLLITGNSDNRVVLNAQQESWNGITFEAGAATAFFDSDENYVSGSTIQYADIVRAGYLSNHGLYLPEGVCPYLLGVDMIDCGSVSAIHIVKLVGIFKATNLKLLKSEETESYEPQHGIYIEGNDNLSGRTFLENVFINTTFAYPLHFWGLHHVSTVRSSSANAIYAISLSYISSLVITHSSFASRMNLFTVSETIIDKNWINGQLYIMDGIKHVVTRNTISISNPSDDAISVSIDYESSLLFLNNIMNNGRFYFESRYWSQQNLTIYENTVRGSSRGAMDINNNGWTYISKNKLEDCNSPLYPVVSINAAAAAEAHFENNTILHSEGKHIFYLVGSPDYDTDSYIFAGNTAAGNSGSSSFVSIAEYPWIFTENIFVNNTSPISIEINMPSFSHDIVHLPLNHWGLFQHDIIDLRRTVYDGFFDSFRQVIDFNPVLSGPSILR